jgi:hypothetical protein
MATQAMGQTKVWVAPSSSSIFTAASAAVMRNLARFSTFVAGERLPSHDGRPPGSAAFHGLRAVSRWLPPGKSGSGTAAAHLEIGNGAVGC